MIWLGIILIAITTYGTRLGGFYLTTWIPTGPRWARAFRDLPGVVLISMVAPHGCSHGYGNFIGIFAVAITYLFWRNVLMSLMVGVGAIVILHHLHL